MTIKEFSMKYEIPYSLAWQASYDVKPAETIRRNKDFSEKDLYRSVMHLLSQRALEKSRQAGEIMAQRNRIRYIYVNRT